MPKIAFIHNCPFPFGGAERVSSLVATMLHRRGFEVWIFCTEVDKSKLSSEELTSICFETCGSFSGQHDFADKVLEFDSRHHFDVIAVLSSLLRGINRISLHTPARIVYFQHSTPFWELRYKFSSIQRRVAHNPYERLRLWLLESVLHRTERRIKAQYLRAYNSCDAFGVLCEGYRRRFEQTYGLGRPNRLRVIRNALPPLPAEYVPDKRHEVLYIGRLSYEDKRLDRLLEIWRRTERRLPDWRLRIGGQGNDKERLQEMAVRTGLQRVEFHPFTTEPWRYYATASICCLTSDYEGWPLVLAEAQQTGTVPIAFDCVEGISDILAPNWENGVLIRPFDLDSYTESLQRLMSDSSLRERISRRCIEKAREYSPDRMVSEWIDMLDTLLAEGPRSVGRRD